MLEWNRKRWHAVWQGQGVGNAGTSLESLEEHEWTQLLPVFIQKLQSSPSSSRFLNRACFYIHSSFFRSVCFKGGACTRLEQKAMFWKNAPLLKNCYIFLKGGFVLVIITLAASQVTNTCYWNTYRQINIKYLVIIDNLAQFTLILWNVFLWFKSWELDLCKVEILFTTLSNEDVIFFSCKSGNKALYFLLFEAAKKGLWNMS